MTFFKSDTPAYLLVRIGVAFAFLFPPLSALRDPDSWVGYFPQFIHFVPLDPLILLHTFGAVEVVLALWILSGIQTFYPALAAALLLLAIVVFNLAQIDVLFRDVSIALASIALALRAREKSLAASTRTQ